ncbi:MFS transporter [Saccharobesus litoralis]|uniref:MFS transporter n=1 Tax=Saccharobesus litoralis TaxID=2172099 RepID=A0A2S0VQV5_9ALTE|nr:MFS transporter [Saccharobesus litoralis]AWB66579.1 MFS transporter [Saccharobesus litoralis]
MKTAITLIIVTLLVQLSSGINYVTFPVILSLQGISNMLIGIAMSFEILAMLMLYSQLARLIQKLGLFCTLVILSCSRAIAIALLAHNDNYLLWLAGIFVYGATTGMLIVLIQTWLASFTLGKSKGLLMGLFSSALSSGVALGPVVLQSLPATINRFYFNSVLILLPMCLMLFLGGQKQIFSVDSQIRVRFIYRHAKIILFSALVGGISFYGLPNFLTLYGINSGLNDQQATLLMTAFMMGSVILGMLISTCSSFINRQSLVLLCVFVAVVCAVFLSLAVYAHYLFALCLLFIWGGCMGGIYAMGLTVIGERFHSQDQMSSNMSYTLMDSLGGILGLVLIGLFIDLLGNDGMAYVIVAAGCTFLIYTVQQMIGRQKMFE